MTTAMSDQTHVDRFARRLRELRAGASLALHELGGTVGRDASTLSRWEQGKITYLPDRDEIIRLEDALGVQNDLLVAAGYAGRGSSTVDLSGLTDADLALVEAFVDRLRSQK